MFFAEFSEKRKFDEGSVDGGPRTKRRCVLVSFNAIERRPLCLSLISQSHVFVLYRKTETGEDTPGVDAKGNSKKVSQRENYRLACLFHA